MNLAEWFRITLRTNLRFTVLTTAVSLLGATVTGLLWQSWRGALVGFVVTYVLAVWTYLFVVITGTQRVRLRRAHQQLRDAVADNNDPDQEQDTP